MMAGLDEDGTSAGLLDGLLGPASALRVRELMINDIAQEWKDKQMPMTAVDVLYFDDGMVGTMCSDPTRWPVLVQRA